MQGPNVDLSLYHIIPNLGTFSKVILRKISEPCGYSESTLMGLHIKRHLRDISRISPKNSVYYSLGGMQAFKILKRTVTKRMSKEYLKQEKQEKE